MSALELTLILIVMAALAKCLSLSLNFLCDKQGAIRLVVLYEDRSCFVLPIFSVAYREEFDLV